MEDAASSSHHDSQALLRPDKPTVTLPLKYEDISIEDLNNNPKKQPPIYEDVTEVKDTNLSLEDSEREMIILALEKHDGKRKQAASELGISERTLYRKIKEYKLNL